MQKKTTRQILKKVLNLGGFALATALLMPAFADAATVRWSQWKTTEVGEKFMAEFKEAFEKDNPGITLELVDSPFQGFHDKAIVQFQAKKLPDVLLVQVDWVAEFADLGLLSPLDDLISKDSLCQKSKPHYLNLHLKTFATFVIGFMKYGLHIKFYLMTIHAKPNYRNLWRVTH